MIIKKKINTLINTFYYNKNLFKENSLYLNNIMQQHKPTAKSDLLMINLTKFFTTKKNYDIILPILNGESKLSLRIIDWFVTNYSKKFNTSYIINGSQFIVYLDYKKRLKAYSKKAFDPFCRRQRIQFYYTKNEHIITTVGQLNFFQWAIQQNIIKYIYKNIHNIENDMNISLKNNYKKKKNKNIRKKRSELSISATRRVNKHNIKILVTFN